MIVALLRDCTKGAKTIEDANMQWAIVHTVNRDGLYLAAPVTTPARDTKLSALSSSGLFTTNGRTMDMMKVMIEKAMSDMEPTRPTLPVRSPAALISGGAS